MNKKFACEKELGNIVILDKNVHMFKFSHNLYVFKTCQNLDHSKISRYTLLVFELIIYKCSCIRKFSHFNFVSS